MRASRRPWQTRFDRSREYPLGQESARQKEHALAMTTHPRQSIAADPRLLVASSCIPFVVYLPTLFNGFVYDDIQQVLNNYWIRDVSHLA